MEHHSVTIMQPVLSLQESRGEEAMDTSQAASDEAAAIREKLLADLNKKG